ncbi:MAG: hypothetical protein K0B11_17915 [Mariniphaga sp.]|nr:hypothetical protein [Mariniphaga sp.]
MSFSPQTFIKIAEEIKIMGNSEAHLRSFINRAYYGAFGYIKVKLNIYSDGASVHREVYENLLRSPSRNKQIAGKNLQRLFKKRKQADYNYNITIQNFECNSTIEDAKRTIELFDSDEDYS